MITTTSLLVSLLVILPLSEATNILANSGFESGNWGNWTLENGSQGNISVVSPGCNKSKYAGAITVDTQHGAVELYYPEIENLALGQQYRFSMDFKLNNLNCASLVQNDEGIALAIGSGLNEVTKGTWGSYNVTFFARRGYEGLNIVTFCNIPANESVPTGPTAEFDNLVFEPVGDTIYSNKSKAKGANLIQQPNFSSGTLKAYQILTEGTTTSKVVKPGYHGATYAVATNLTGTSVVEFLQDVPESRKDGVYRLSVAFKTLTKLDLYCAGQTYIQQSGFVSYAENVPFSLAIQFPVNENSIPPVGKWVVYEGLVSGLTNNITVGIELDCDTDGGEFEIGAIQLIPL